MDNEYIYILKLTSAILHCINTKQGHACFFFPFLQITTVCLMVPVNRKASLLWNKII